MDDFERMSYMFRRLSLTNVCDSEYYGYYMTCNTMLHDNLLIRTDHNTLDIIAKNIVIVSIDAKKVKGLDCDFSCDFLFSIFFINHHRRIVILLRLKEGLIELINLLKM